MSALVFAYGSNLSAKQMLRRCSQVRVVSTGLLRHHELLFSGMVGSLAQPRCERVP